jgi:hypothetical protein
MWRGWIRQIIRQLFDVLVDERREYRNVVSGTQQMEIRGRRVGGRGGGSVWSIAQAWPVTLDRRKWEGPKVQSAERLYEIYGHAPCWHNITHFSAMVL